ncbi:MAG: hypothetical protein N3D10_01935 [Candidatus Micrarchaeota archaeon]|nr:hypothetical protein [Candidatus Micrarchaeota archaeon]
MAIEEPDMSKFKLKKSSFKFIQLKKYQAKKHYLIKKYQKNIIQQLLENFKAQTTKKSAIVKEEKSDLKSFILKNPILAGGAILLFLFLVFFLFSTFTKPSLTHYYPSEHTASFSGDLTLKVIDSGILSHGSVLSPAYEPFVVFEYEPKSLKNASLEAIFYLSKPSKQLFILDYYKDGADTYPAFRQKLENILRKNGWLVTDITIDDLKDLPGSCTLLIPTGYLPIQLLGKDGYPSILDLADRGVVLIYLGQPFDENVFDEVGNIQPSDKEKVKALNIVFDKKFQFSPSENFSLLSPYYAAKYGEGAQNILWGSISVLAYNKGYVLFLPQALDGAWGGNSDLAAEQISRLITTEPYRPKISSVSTNLEINSSNFTIKRKSVFFGPVQYKEGHIRLIFSLLDEKNTSQKKFFDWPVFVRTNSNLYMDNNLFVPTYLGGQKKVLTIMLNESPIEEVKLFFQVYKDGELKEAFAVEQGFTKTIVTRSSPVSFSLAPGDYILKVVDSNGKFYAGAKIQIIPIEIEITGPDKRVFNAFKEGKFNVSFSSNSTPLVVPKVVVYIENKKNAPKREFSSVSNFVYDAATNFDRGDYTFVFDFNGYIQKVTLSFNLPPNMWERPDVQVLGVLAIITILFAVYVVSRPKKDMFSLDIPDFGVEEYREIKLKPKQILEVFDLVNKDFKWESMPLSLAELKDGFLKLTIDGHPIVVGEYNLEEVLAKLENKKLVASYLGFWIPTSWLDKSNFNIKKIAMYRYLRDIFVTNAVKFSKLRDIKTDNFDVKILLNNIIYYIYLFDGDYSINYFVIKKASEGNCWIVFEDRTQIKKFLEKVSSLTTKNSLLLKLYINNSKVQLVSLDNFEELLKKLKI